MADPISALASRASTEPPAYRPLSGVALTAFGLAAIYAIVVAVLGGVSLSSGTPLFLGVWILLVPVAAFVLATVARQQIRRSEGTKGGAILVTWAWWLSVLFGLGYATFYLTTYFVVKKQAENIIQAFFNRLREGDINSAYYLTLEPLQRKGLKPTDATMMFERFGLPRGGGHKGPLGMFRDNDTVRLVEQGGPNLEVLPLGVKDWAYEKGGYSVLETYRITTPEGSWHVLIAARSTENKQTEGRQWNVSWDTTRVLGTPRLTAFGQTIERWRKESRSFALNWVERRNQGDLMGAYLETRPPAERDRLVQTFFLEIGLAAATAGFQVALAGPPAGLPYLSLLVDPERGRQVYLPGYRDAGARLIRDKDFQALKRIREEIIQDVKLTIDKPESTFLRMPPEGKGRPLEPVEGKPLRFLHDMEMGLFPDGPGRPPKYRCEAALIVESDQETITPGKPPVWRVVGIQLNSGGTPPVEKESGPPTKGLPPGTSIEVVP